MYCFLRLVTEPDLTITIPLHTPCLLLFPMSTNNHSRQPHQGCFATAISERRHSSGSYETLLSLASSRPTGSSRWMPDPEPKQQLLVRYHQLPDESSAPHSESFGAGNERLVRSHQDRENNYRHSGGGGEGRQGGGKIVRQRCRGSNDTHHTRNPHYRRPPPHKNIITPTEMPSFSAARTTTTTIDDGDTPKLDPSIPADARRMNQRLRQVLYGKNTVGYEEYTKKVPRHKRKQRSLECPMTPDHTADIPTKRWQGLMNAW